MTANATLIVNARLVNEGREYDGDLRIADGRIAEIGTGLQARAGAGRVCSAGTTRQPTSRRCSTSRPVSAPGFAGAASEEILPSTAPGTASASVCSNISASTPAAVRHSARTIHGPGFGNRRRNASCEPAGSSTCCRGSTAASTAASTRDPATRPARGAGCGK